MISDFHFLRPWWLIALLPLLMVLWRLLRRTSALAAWSEVCDAHLLSHLLKSTGNSSRTTAIMCLFGSLLFMIISLAGPTWSRYPVPTFDPVQPRVIVLDMSEAMLNKDVSPNRLGRAKFKLHDLFKLKNQGQFGMVVFTGEPFVVSPLTDDARTIDALLSSLTPNVMPVAGHRLDSALIEAGKLITQAGFQQGNVLVMTATAPDSSAMSEARSLASQGIQVSILPVQNRDEARPLFNRFAEMGNGVNLSLSTDSTDLKRWLSSTKTTTQYTAGFLKDVPVWNDEGRWFLIPSILLFLPVFWRGWLLRITT